VVDSIRIESSAAAAPEPDDSLAPEPNRSLATLSAIADPVRWTVLQRLSHGRTCVCDLHEVTGVAPNLLSYHLKVLRDAHLVLALRRGRWVDYELAEDALEQMRRALPVEVDEP
jgi:ArsR family transcriptional regulator, arsenate/arsenite/antimonite-responsive transcriptional repressor